MPPLILIIEPRHEVAAALEDVLTSANYRAMVVPHLERLADLDWMPSAIVVRVVFEGLEPAHTAIGKLPPDRPPVVAIAWEAAEIAEAERLRCDVVLHAPKEVSRLCEELARVLQTDRESGLSR
jgi:hypothetical protein